MMRDVGEVLMGACGLLCCLALLCVDSDYCRVYIGMQSAGNGGSVASSERMPQQKSVSQRRKQAESVPQPSGRGLGFGYDQPIRVTVIRNSALHDCRLSGHGSRVHRPPFSSSTLISSCVSMREGSSAAAGPSSASAPHLAIPHPAVRTFSSRTHMQPQSVM